MRQRRRHLVGLACLCLVMGLAHGLLLCVGCDGRAALHSSLHTHNHTDPLHETRSVDHSFSDNHEDEHSHCSRCVDIPLSMVVANDYVGSTPKSFSLSPDSDAFDLANLQAERLDSHLKQAIGNAPYFAPLSSIILLV